MECSTAPPRWDIAQVARSARNDLVGDFENQISYTSCTTTNRAVKTLTALLSGAAKLLTALLVNFSRKFPGTLLILTLEARLLQYSAI